MDMGEDSDGLLAQQEKETNSIAVSITGEDPPAGVYFIKSNNYCCSVFLICQYACIETCMYLHKDG